MKITLNELQNKINERYYNGGYQQGKADRTKELISLANCEYADCFKCAFGGFNGCLLKKIGEEE